MSHSWIFNCKKIDYTHDVDEFFRGACYQVTFTINSPGAARVMGYVQFVFKKTPEALKEAYPYVEWFPSTNDPAIYRAYEAAPCALQPPSVFGIPRPKNPYRPLLRNPFSDLKKKAKAFMRRELQKVALDLLNQA